MRAGTAFRSPIRADWFWRGQVIALEIALAAEAPPHLARMAAEAVVELRRIARMRQRLIGGAADGAATIETLRKLDLYEALTYAKRRKAFRLMQCHRLAGGQLGGVLH
jgi:hypothetical protein